MPPEQREAWYERQFEERFTGLYLPSEVGSNVGLDLLDFPTILFYETGYSTYVLRQASRRSWRIGQKRPVRVGFLSYAEHGAGVLSAADGEETYGFAARWKESLRPAVCKRWRLMATCLPQWHASW